MAAARARRRQLSIVVELDHPELSPDGRPVTRVCTVRLRRGHHVVVIADNLGWPTANALACQLDHSSTRPPTRTEQRSSRHSSQEPGGE
jgi:hypothetical protein